MTRHALVATFGAGWVTLLAMRLAMNYAGASSMTSLSQIAGVVTPITAFWIPVIVIALWLGRRSRLVGGRLVAAHAVAGLLVIVSEPAITRAILSWAGVERPYTTLLVGRLDTNALIYALIVAADVVLVRLEAFRAREIAAARVEQALVDTQLHVLAIQLQPHFLFNALQFVAETAHQDLAMARRTLSHLRELVHQAFMLESRLEVTIAEELSFLEAYGEIQRSRFGERFLLTIDADAGVLDAAIPPLLLQPLVENASRHGFAKRSIGGRVDVTVREEGPMISIVVSNDGAQLPGRIIEGQGLSVTRRRIERLHGPTAGLALSRAADGRTLATVRFPKRALVAANAATILSADLPLEPALDDRSGRLPVGWRLLFFWSGLLALVIGATAVAAAFGPAARNTGLRLDYLLVDEIVALPFWAGMTICAVFAGRRLRGSIAIPAHALIAVAFAAAHMFLGDFISRAVLGESRPLAAYQQWAVWNVLVYAALVLIARSHDLREWMRARMRQQALLNEEVAQATRRLDHLRDVQADLIASLDRIMQTPTMESLDREIIDFAGYVRREVMADTTVAVGAAR